MDLLVTFKYSFYLFCKNEMRIFFCSALSFNFKIDKFKRCLLRQRDTVYNAIVLVSQSIQHRFLFIRLNADLSVTYDKRSVSVYYSLQLMFLRKFVINFVLPSCPRGTGIKSASCTHLVSLAVLQAL